MAKQYWACWHDDDGFVYYEQAETRGQARASFTKEFGYDFTERIHVRKAEKCSDCGEFGYYSRDYKGERYFYCYECQRRADQEADDELDRLASLGMRIAESKQEE